MRFIRLVIILCVFTLLSSCSLNNKASATYTPQPTFTPMNTSTPDNAVNSKNIENKYIADWNNGIEQTINSYMIVDKFLLELENNPDYIPNEAWISDFHKAVDSFEKNLDIFCNIEPVPSRFVDVSQTMKLANNEFKIAFMNFQEFGKPNESALNQFGLHWNKGMEYFQNAWNEFELITAP